jgi:metal-responsive CopG/Arc/MetJ family transcriptional regulator
MVMKNTTTVAISLPETLLSEIDKMAKDANISRSAIITATMSIVMQWTKQSRTEILNSLYGKGVIE